MTTIDIINKTSSDAVLKDADLEAATKAIQRQIDNEFSSAWGIAATLNFVPRSETPSNDHWWIVALDNSDVQGALGYHDLTSVGLPCGKVFVATCQQYSTSWTVDLDHEVLEMLVDPDINSVVLIENQRGNVLYAKEVGDPVQSDACGYLAGDEKGTPLHLSDNSTPLLLSDFAYPAWFETFWSSGQTKFDHMGHVTQSFQIAPGGYMSVFQLATGKWSQINAAMAPRTYEEVPRVGTRRERRSRDRDAWILSKF